MAIVINFDNVHNPEPPSLILAKRSGEKIGQLNAKHIVLQDDLNNANELSFSVYKYINNTLDSLWDEITDLKLVWCKDWDMWFEISVDIKEDTKTTKDVTCTQLAQAELSQTMLFNIEINTENDIARDDYINPTILYKPSNQSESLLHRIMEKVPHYYIAHVDNSIANIQDTFTFDNISLYDALLEIGQKLDCLFIFNSGTAIDGSIERSISVFDLESYCQDCGNRGQFTEECPKCHSTSIIEGYGNDTTVFVTADELANNITFTNDVASVKNCLKISGNDDYFNATIRSVNPNGSQYLWYISDKNKSDMSDALVTRIESYDALYDEYENVHEYTFSDNNLVNDYNDLVTKYNVYNDNTFSTLVSPVVGYASLMELNYNTIDFAIYLKSVLMPHITIPDTNASEQLSLLTAVNLSPVSATDISHLSVYSANNIVMTMAKAVVDARFKVDIKESTLNPVGNHYVWQGKFTVTNYNDANDTVTGNTVIITINDDYESFVKQKMQQILHGKQPSNVTDIVALFKLSLNNFKEEMKKYCLDSLTSFANSCQACLDILIEEDISNQSVWSTQAVDMYSEVYLPFYEKLKALEAEIKVRENEIAIIEGLYDGNGRLKTKGIQNYIDDFIADTHSALDFETYLTEELWYEFLSFRREGTYSNTNYFSDGLNNAELFEKVKEFIETAKKELYKSAELQHSISSTLKNLLVIKKFAPLLSHFSVGNWIRVLVDDNVYKLRLLKYSIDFDNLETLSVEFSDVFKTVDGEADQYSLIQRASQMTSSYASVQHQASQGSRSQTMLTNMQTNGLDISSIKLVNDGNTDGQTQTWDEHGLLLRRFNASSNTYDDTQMKIINSTLSVTDDDWRTTKTAVGLFKYLNPDTGKYENAFGINGEVIVGKMFLGQNMKLVNSSQTLVFDDNGLEMTNGINTIKVNPNDTNSLISISTNSTGESKLWTDSAGMLHFEGDGTGLDITNNATTDNLQSQITTNANNIILKVSKDEVINMINVSGEGVAINADKINLCGAVTANENFKIYVDGSMSSILGDIGGWLIHPNSLSKNVDVLTEAGDGENEEDIYTMYQTLLYSSPNSQRTNYPIVVRSRQYTESNSDDMPDIYDGSIYDDWDTLFSVNYDGFLNANAGAKFDAWRFDGKSLNNSNYTGSDEVLLHGDAFSIDEDGVIDAGNATSKDTIVIDGGSSLNEAYILPENRLGIKLEDYNIKLKNNAVIDINATNSNILLESGTNKSIELNSASEYIRINTTHLTTTNSDTTYNIVLPASNGTVALTSDLPVNPDGSISSPVTELRNMYNIIGTSANRPTSANITPNNNGSIRTFLATASMTTGKPIADGNILHFSWDNSNRYASQLAIVHNTTHPIQWRYQNGTGQNDWTAWESVALASQAISNITRDGVTFTATRADGTTFTFTQRDNNTTYSNATTSAAGLMSADDKTKLDNLYNIDTTFTNRYLRVNNTSAKAGSQGYSQLWLGNATDKSAAGNSCGGVVLYGTNTKYSYITANIALSDNYTLAVPNKGGTIAVTSDAISNITRSGTTFTATKADGTTFTFTQQDNNTTYSAGTGISISSTTISNSGVRSIATGSANGKISVNTNGTSADVAVKGLGSMAYTNTGNYAAISGDTFTGTVKVIKTSSTAGTVGTSYLQLGNTTDISATGNSRGILQLCAQDTHYINLYPVDTLSANRNIRLPDAAGTLGVLKTVTTTNKVNTQCRIETDLYLGNRAVVVGATVTATKNFMFVPTVTLNAKTGSTFGRWELLVFYTTNDNYGNDTPRLAPYNTSLGTITIYYLQF